MLACLPGGGAGLAMSLPVGGQVRRPLQGGGWRLLLLMDISDREIFADIVAFT